MLRKTKKLYIIVDNFYKIFIYLLIILYFNKYNGLIFLLYQINVLDQKNNYL